MGNDTCKTCHGDGEAYVDFKYQRCPDCRPTADEEIAALLVQVADLKERADIADSIHKEMMEKLARYRKALADIGAMKLGEGLALQQTDLLRIGLIVVTALDN